MVTPPLPPLAPEPPPTPPDPPAPTEPLGPPAGRRGRAGHDSIRSVVGRALADPVGDCLQLGGHERCRVLRHLASLAEIDAEGPCGALAPMWQSLQRASRIAARRTPAR